MSEQVTVTMDRLREDDVQLAYEDACERGLSFGAFLDALFLALHQTPSGEECDCVRWADPSWPGCPIHGYHGPSPAQPSGEEEDPPCTCDNSRYPEGQGGCELHNPPHLPPRPQPSGQEGEGEAPTIEQIHAYCTKRQKQMVSMGARCSEKSDKELAKSAEIAYGQVLLFLNAAHPHGQEAPEEQPCPDDGACHHRCRPGECWRVHHAAPLSGFGDDWTAEHREKIGCPCGCDQEAPQVSSAQGYDKDPDAEPAAEKPAITPSGLLVSSAQAEYDSLETVDPETDPRFKPRVSSGDVPEWVKEKSTAAVLGLLKRRFGAIDDEKTESQAQQLAGAAIGAVYYQLRAPSTLTDEERDTLRYIADLVERHLNKRDARFLRTLAGKGVE